MNVWATAMVCEDCGHDFPVNEVRCPHCGRPSLFPNVTAAGFDEERQALQARYQAAKNEAVNRGAVGVVEEFERACEQSSAVISRTLGEAFRLANSDSELYATYYQLQTLRVPRGLRRQNPSASDI